MEKEIYTLKELVAIGYPRKMLYELARSKYSNKFCFRYQQSGTWRFNRSKLDKFLSEITV